MSNTRPNLPRPFGVGSNGHTKYEENLKKYVPYGDTTIACCYCGRHARSGTTFAFLSNMSEFIRQEEGGDDFLGMYPVGSDCAKILKDAGVTLYDQDGKEK